MNKHYCEPPIVTIITITFCLTLILSSYAKADITLKSENIQVVLQPQYGWTTSELLWDGRYFIESSGSGQGTVFLIDGVWAGSIHFNETVLEAKLIIDANSVELVDGAQYQGNEIQFYRRTLLYNAYLLTSVMTISGNSITEDVSLQGVDSSKTVEKAYGVQGSRANRFTDYFGYNLDGNKIVQGKTDSNDGTMHNLSPAVSVCQYDPQTGDALLSTITDGYTFDLEHLIWDRNFDNKLYARFRDIEDDCGFSKNYILQQHLDFFSSPIENLHEKAEGIIKTLYCPKIKGDINDDCKVDINDFAILAANWLGVCD